VAEGTGPVKPGNRWEEPLLKMVLIPAGDVFFWQIRVEVNFSSLFCLKRFSICLIGKSNNKGGTINNGN